MNAGKEKGRELVASWEAGHGREHLKPCGMLKPFPRGLAWECPFVTDNNE